MSKPQRDKHICIPYWVPLELGPQYNLSWPEMVTFSIIYGFTKSGKTFSGGYDFLIAATKSSKKTVSVTLQKLQNKGLIEKCRNHGRFGGYDEYISIFESAEITPSNSNSEGFESVETTPLKVSKLHPESVEITLSSDIKKNKRNIKLKSGDTRTQTRQKKTPFTVPSLDEIKEYCRQINSSINPETFFDYYESIGWKDVQNWQAKIRYWEKTEPKYTEQQNRYVKPGQVQPDPNRTSIDWDELQAYIAKDIQSAKPANQPEEQADIQPEPVQQDYEPIHAGNTDSPVHIQPETEPIPAEQTDSSTLIPADQPDEPETEPAQPIAKPDQVAADQSDSSTLTETEPEPIPAEISQEKSSSYTNKLDSATIARLTEVQARKSTDPTPEQVESFCKMQGLDQQRIYEMCRGHWERNWMKQVLIAGQELTDTAAGAATGIVIDLPATRQNNRVAL